MFSATVGAVSGISYIMSDLPKDFNSQEVSGEPWEPEPTPTLSNRDRDIFLALLDADHEPNEALKAAAAEYRKGWREGDVYHFHLPARNPNAGDASDR